jgi:hypothetical protein
VLRRELFSRGNVTSLPWSACRGERRALPRATRGPSARDARSRALLYCDPLDGSVHATRAGAPETFDHAQGRERSRFAPYRAAPQTSPVLRNVRRRSATPRAQEPLTTRDLVGIGVDDHQALRTNVSSNDAASVAKYDALRRHLERQNGDVVMSFAAIDALLAGGLPKAGRLDRTWRDYEPYGRDVHARGWLDAGQTRVKSSFPMSYRESPRAPESFFLSAATTF